MTVLFFICFNAKGKNLPEPTILEKQFDYTSICRWFPTRLGSIFLQEEEDLQMESIQGICESSLEWRFQQICLRVRLQRLEKHRKKKNPKAIFQTLQASLSSVNAKVHDSTIEGDWTSVRFVWEVGGVHMRKPVCAFVREDGCLTASELKSDLPRQRSDAWRQS